MALKINNADEFKYLLSMLSANIIDAAIHYKLFRDLSRDLSKKPEVVAQSSTFWNLTVKSHLQNSLILLCKSYDQNDDSLHLKNWLETIQNNIDLFDETNFRDRLKDNPFVGDLAKHPRRPDIKELEKDILWCSNSNEIVKKLTIHRGNIIAHTSAKPVIRNIKLDKTHPITHKEIGMLIDEGVRILNKYSSLYEANIFSTNMVGSDDYKIIIDAIGGWVNDRQRAHMTGLQSPLN